MRLNAVSDGSDELTYWPCMVLNTLMFRVLGNRRGNKTFQSELYKAILTPGLYM
jgi:hypothetical protein